MHPLVKDMTGQRFGRLLVVSLGSRKGRRRHWVCQCDCGAVLEIQGPSLRRGVTQSCGCLKIERARAMGASSKVHGHAATRTREQTRTYESWRAMLKRCEDVKHEAFARYGGAGITVCERWHSFASFLADMGERPNGKTLDRYPNNRGNYEPGNCRWATPKEQVANSRRYLKATASGSPCAPDEEEEDGCRNAPAQDEEDGE